ncbi:NUDIX hydrolase [Rhodospirillaceae bacterium]|nr:NUDIX hydrolase [Rhodospirillaceae bacterium]
MLNDLEKKTPSVPVTPVPAATVMVLRDTPSGIEVLMVQRTQKADFAGGALLFPGGKVDEDDHHLLTSKLCDFSEAIDNELRALRIAGAREIFEEAGLLFARDAKSGQLIDNVRAQVINGKYRQKLLNKELTFSQIISDENLAIATDLLVPFAHWITPITGKKKI